jgi:hypothetical protein
MMMSMKREGDLVEPLASGGAFICGGRLGKRDTLNPGREDGRDLGNDELSGSSGR